MLCFRYTNMKAKWLKPKQVMHLYDTGENTLRDEVIEIPAKSAQEGKATNQHGIVIVRAVYFTKSNLIRVSVYVERFSLL